MSQRRDDVMLPDEPEITPNPQNLATALMVIGQTARKGPVSQGPTVPEHREFFASPYHCTKSHSRAATPFERPSSPIPMSPVTSTHLDAPAAITVPEESIDDESLITADDDTVMDQDMSNAAAPFPLVDPPNRSPPAHCPPTITPPRQRPLPLPPASQHYLGQLLHEQFVELSDKVVVPALRNAVDAMMPAMIEQIAGEIRGITSTCPHKPRARKHSGAMEEDTEPECEDDLTPSPRRKHPGKQGYLSQISTGQVSAEFQEWSTATIPPSQMAQAFNRDNESPPRLDNIAIDWNDSLRKSPWNTEVINLLVVDFQAKIKTGSYASILFDKDMMNLDDLRILCVDKLRRTHQAHRDHNKIKGFAHSQERENATRELASRSSQRQCLDRLNTHKHRTLERRRKIAEQNNHRNP
ncbi:hypothetical protein C8R48DRAFT_779409 [Suillus tomentosus]|nr:hypothetical protein C8R48DRAFT_779409 [Suillus tomentosus]